MKVLAKPAKYYILGTILVGTVLLAWNLLNLQLQDPWMLLALMLFACVTHILKVEGPTPRSNYQVSFIVYGFALILLGPAQTALIIAVAHIVEWASYRYPWYIQSFNLASFVIALNVSSLVSTKFIIDPQQFGIVNLAGMLLTVAIFTILNHVMMGLVLLLARGETFAKSEVFVTLNLMIDYTLFGLGIAGALTWEYNPFMVTFIAIPVYLIYMTLKIPALKRQTNTDSKTGLYNMRFFNQVLANELARAKRFGHPLTLVMSDLDLFRNINTVYGHSAGDKILVGIADIMKKSFRNYDVVARFGGEEFVILMPETLAENAFERVEALRRTIETTGFEVSTSPKPVFVTMSFGLATSREDGQSEQDLINDADLAMYQSKANGRNSTSLFRNKGVTSG